MGKKDFVILSGVLATLIYVSSGCQIDDQLLWTTPIHTSILDTYEGIVISRDTTDIEGINSTNYGQATLGGPYFDISIESSQLVVRTNNEYMNYEEIEVASRVAITVVFNCIGGDTRGGLILWIDITDTNNHEPRFHPTTVYEFVVTPPLPPGYSITGCANDVITVRDIDLTTQRIDFTIENTTDFEVVYDENSTTTAKVFNAQLRTTTFIRSLSEPLILRITATDVDLTLDLPLSTTTVVRIVADSEFQFPEEPVFGQTFYLANYTDDHQLHLLETISLQQGFDEYVNFTLEGESEYVDYFDVEPNGNRVSLVVVKQLPDSVWSERQILLVVKAKREHTSGDSATIIVQLPEDTLLEFERAFYEGYIVNNSLQLQAMALSQGYLGVEVNAEVIGEYSAFFNGIIQQDLITLTMEPLPNNIIDYNTLISFQLVAASNHSSASTVVNLAIIKDDNVTPVFDKPIYSGSYDPVTGLSVEQIEIVQGFDETVLLELVGDNVNFFQILDVGPIITLNSSTIPPEIFSQQNILITIKAIKPRTVGANAVIHIALPAARELEFEEYIYTGSIENSVLLLETLILIEGYEDGVNFNLSGEYSTYFTASNERGQVDIILTSSLPDIAITQNSILILTLTASGINAVTTSTIILLDVIKNDMTTPVFSQAIYYGTYSEAGIEIDAINLRQGFDESVAFRLDGVHAQYFNVANTSNGAVISLQSPIPEDEIFNEKVLLFNVLADKEFTVGANAAVLIRFPKELTDVAIMRFAQNTYVGSLEGNETRIRSIVLETGFVNGSTEFILSGELREHFSLSNTNNVIELSRLNTLPNNVLEDNDIILLEIEARRLRAASVWTSVVLEIVKQQVIAPVFSQAYYTGLYTKETELTFIETINITEGYDEVITFALNGESSEWFDLHRDGNSVTLILQYPVPANIVESNSHLLFTIVANNINNVTGRAVVSIDLPKVLTNSQIFYKEFSENSFRFQENIYKGFFINSSINLDAIILEGYTIDVNYTLIGDFNEYIQLTNENGTFTMQVETSIPEDALQETNILMFTLEAQNVNSKAHTIIVLEYIRPIQENLNFEFEQPYYIGNYSASESLQFNSEIRLINAQQHNATFDLDGEGTQWFGLEQNNDFVVLMLINPIPEAVLINNQQLVLVVIARSQGSAIARATIVVSLNDSIEETLTILGFNRITYIGSLEKNETLIPTITLNKGFTDAVNFTLHGDLADYFSLSPQLADVTVELQDVIPEHSIPANRLIVLEIHATAPQAVTAFASIVVKYIVEDNVSSVVELIFAQTFYNGSFDATTGLSFLTPISLIQGYNSYVVFDVEGDNSEWFSLDQNENSVKVILNSTVPLDVLENKQQLVIVVTAQAPGTATARATVIVHLSDYLQPGSDVTFDKVLYKGFLENNTVHHETIIVVGYSGSTIELRGEYTSQFVANLTSGEVTVSMSASLTLPDDVNNVALELHAGTASAVLLLSMSQTVDPNTPTVSFGSSSHAIRISTSDTGLVGQVEATASNGEALTYSLLLNNALLEEALSINGEGQLNLSSPLLRGLYTFEVVATTVATQEQGTATVHLSVESTTICLDEHEMNPLIIIDIDEEEPHYDLLNGTQFENCHFILNNRWPVNHSWVYVNESGLHTTAIDREHQSIAFMPVSQVQVEVILVCEGDLARNKRSLTSDALGPYDYGSNKWILTDTIIFNSRKSFVNIIVNDINDNAPIFIGKENEPLAVGYPVPELAERVLPRALAELRATDADIGENAALLYWSAALELAVAPTTGFVHLRDGAILLNGSRFTLNATDRNGQGLTGSVDILVRLLDENYISVVTIRDAFLDEEHSVIYSISEAVGYEIKVLRSVVISYKAESDASRKKRDAPSVGGASLQLYVYGLVAREPVPVEQLTADISNIVTVNVVSSVSLQDHLEGQEICVILERDAGLLVATIVLSIFLFIALVLIAVWFFLRWRKNRNYDRFSDENSASSRNASVDNIPNTEVMPKLPRLEFEEMKKSERRLQDMLDAPVQEVFNESANLENDTIVSMSEPITPMFIQSIDKLKGAADDTSDDEFGEVKIPKRKSVVTFNEIVEKIIHLEDSPDTENVSEDSNYEIYQF